MLDQLACIWRQVAQPPDADGELAHGPRIGQLDDRDRHGTRDPPRRALRHDPYPHIALDQPAHSVEAAQLHPQSQRPPDRRRLFGEKALQRAGSVETNKIVVENFSETAALNSREGVEQRNG